MSSLKFRIIISFIIVFHVNIYPGFSDSIAISVVLKSHFFDVDAGWSDSDNADRIFWFLIKLIRFSVG